jgi:hypothetical protein
MGKEGWRWEGGGGIGKERRGGGEKGGGMEKKGGECGACHDGEVSG